MELGENSDEVARLDLPLQLQEILPCGYSYKLKKWTPLEKDLNHFEADLFTNVYTEDEAQEWWHKFNAKSKVTMRVRATCPKTGKVNTFKIYLRCLHQGRTEKAEKPDQQQKGKLVLPVKRNTNCPAGMIIAIRRLVKYSRSKMRDPVDPVHPCEIQIRFVHNHPIHDAISLRFRPKSRKTEQKLLSLYQIGHSPTSGLEMLKFDLQIEHGPHYTQVISDRYYCPDKSFCYRLYYKNFGKDYAASVLKDIGNVLSSKVAHYNTVLGETCLAIGLSEANHVIAICTPLMKRAHSLPQAGDMVYIELFESVGNKERPEHNVLLLLVHTAIGGIPVGCILTTSNSTENFTLGFQLLKQLLSPYAFFNRNEAGPHSFSTDDSENLRKALNAVWPESDVIVCIFRILQTMWRWLWDEKHNILKDHRLYLLYFVKTLLFASDEAEMGSKYQALCADNITVHYPQYLQQLEYIWQKRYLWGICFHGPLPLQGASNYYEAAVRTLKDKMLECTKMFNIVQMLNFLVTRLDLFYKNKFLTIVEGKISNVFHCHFSNIVPAHVINNIEQIAGSYYLVPNELGEEKMYTIDAELNICSCPSGINGALCVHQYWVFLKTPTDMFKVGFLDKELKYKILYIATGSTISSDVKNVSEVSTEFGKNSDIAEAVISTTVKTDFSETNSSSIVENVLPTNNILSNFPSNDQFVSLPCINNNFPVISEVFVNAAPESFSKPNIVSKEDLNVMKSKLKDSTDENFTNGLSNAENIKTEERKECPNTETNKRMTEVLKKFETFCQRVKDGLKDNTKEFLPALEIMMKNLERKGNSSEQIISGLSFFGVLSAPSLMSKRRKRPICAITAEEILPKVHGRQMNTYGKRHLNALSSSKSTGECKKPCPVTTAVATLKELAYKISESILQNK